MDDEIYKVYKEREAAIIKFLESQAKAVKIMDVRDVRRGRVSFWGVRFKRENGRWPTEEEVDAELEKLKQKMSDK